VKKYAVDSSSSLRLSAHSFTHSFIFFRSICLSRRLQKFQAALRWFGNESHDTSLQCTTVALSPRNNVPRGSRAPVHVKLHSEFALQPSDRFPCHGDELRRPPIYPSIYLSLKNRSRQTDRLLSTADHGPQLRARRHRTRHSRPPSRRWPATAHAHLGARSGGFLSCLWFEEARANMDEAGLESSSDDEELELLSGSSILSGSVLECRRGGE